MDSHRSIGVRSVSSDVDSKEADRDHKGIVITSAHNVRGPMANTQNTDAFRKARDFLVSCATDYDHAYAGFRWPVFDTFNWAVDWFDAIAVNNERCALRIVNEDGLDERWTFLQMSTESSRLARWLRGQGVHRGDRIIVMLDNQAELWLSMLAIMKLGAVVIPATTLLSPTDLRDRVVRGNARHVIAASAQTGKFAEIDGEYTRIAVGGEVPGWLDFTDSISAPANFVVERTAAEDPLLLYFTSGTTSTPKLVEHTHVSYPVGHLSTMYWIGLGPGDVHANVASPGWAKHAWSSFFAPWNAEATIFVLNYNRFDAIRLMRALDWGGVTSICAPPTVWRLIIQADMSILRTPPRIAVSAGEPLNPEVIEQVERAWGVTIRDGFGQTETTLQIGNTPGQMIKPGSMGRPVPGYQIMLIDPITSRPADEGEICLPLSDRPLGLMVGYRDDDNRNSDAMRDDYYHTGDIASRDLDGYITYIGRSDDVFKSSDYRISPFELESLLIEHEAVAEAAVVPSPDPIRLSVPKAFVVLAPGWQPSAETAADILKFASARLAPYKRIRRIQFAELPKTISGKIRRVDLRLMEAQRGGVAYRFSGEYWEDEIGS